MPEKVYLETSIFSFYYDERTAVDIVARRNWTRKWFENRRKDFEIVTSDAVVTELEQGSLSHKEAAYNMALSVPILRSTNELKSIVDTYIKNRLMPADPFGDALHLAFASYYQIDFLLTWNCSHLANGNKFGHIRKVNTTLNLFVPILTTPLELLGDFA